MPKRASLTIVVESVEVRLTDATCGLRTSRPSKLSGHPSYVSSAFTVS
jgi:hypothetical protein